MVKEEVVTEVMNGVVVMKEVVEAVEAVGVVEVEVVMKEDEVVVEVEAAAWWRWQRWRRWTSRGGGGGAGGAPAIHRVVSERVQDEQLLCGTGCGLAVLGVCLGRGGGRGGLGASGLALCGT